MANRYPGIYSPFLHNYDDIRLLYKSIHEIEQRHGPCWDWHEVQVSARVVYRRPFRDPLAVPITKGWRTYSDDNGETGTDYRILLEDPADPWTDEQIEQYMLDSDVYCGRGRHDFDCSGDRFTRSWHFHRTPIGIVLFHDWAIDI